MIGKGDVVVALKGPCRNDMGVVVGPDRFTPGKLLVRFPGNAFPNDFRTAWPANLRLATDGENLVRVA